MSSQAAGPVIALSNHEAEPDPLESATTRRMTLPAAMLEALGSAEEGRVPGPSLRVVSSAVLSAARAPPEDPFLPPPGHCPKCIGVRPENALMCPFCGLDYALFQPEAFEPSEELAQAWRGVWESWEDPAVHDRVLALASQKGELAVLGRLYRIRLAHLPEDALAQRGREEVVRLASVSSMLAHEAPPDKGMKWKVLGAGLLFLVALSVTVFLVRQLMLVTP